jgi:hypothetical protein
VADQPVIVLPPLAGGQAESWGALVELAPAFGDNWLLVGGQMVFLHELERQSTDVRPTADIDVIVDLRAGPNGLARIHSALISASFDQGSPGLEGTAHRYRRGAAVIDVWHRLQAAVEYPVSVLLNWPIPGVYDCIGSALRRRP